MNIILEKELQEIPCNVITRANGFGSNILEVNFYGRTFTVVKELFEEDRYELGYYTWEGLQVLRYLTVDEIINNIIEIGLPKTL